MTIARKEERLEEGVVGTQIVNFRIPGFFSVHEFFMLDCLCTCKHSKTSFEKNCFSAWASTLNMGLINKVDMVCLSPVGYGV